MALFITQIFGGFLDGVLGLNGTGSDFRDPEMLRGVHPPVEETDHVSSCLRVSATTDVTMAISSF